MKKRVNGAWVTTSPLKYGTSTDTLTTLPADLYADGQSATVGLVGNMSQTGIPTPTTPIQPQETGERTGNLFDKDNALTYNAWINPANQWVSQQDSRSVKIPCEPNKQYTLTTMDELSIFRIYEYNDLSVIPKSSSPAVLNEITRSENRYAYTFTTAPDTQCIVFQGTASIFNTWINKLMLVEGSTTPSSYIPYGIKIPISSANTTTPIYLGEVTSTRNVYKMIFTGEETFTDVSSGSRKYFRTYIRDIPCKPQTYEVICTHYSYVRITSETTDVGVMSSVPTGGAAIYFRPENVSSTSIDDFKTFLANQYAAGTPVTVWYVLAEPTTGIVNEPIRKIGDYADTVSGISIPTTTGADSFDVQTTLKPSEVSLAYTGWHDATVKEWDGSEWQ